MTTTPPTTTPSRRRWRTTAAVVACLALAMGVGCGDDDDASGDDDPPATSQAADDTTTTTEGADAELTAYCDASLAIETAGEPDIDFETATPEEIGLAYQAFATDTLRPLVDDALATAPDEIIEDGTAVSDAIDELIATGDSTAFDSDEVAEATARIHEFDLGSCGWESVSFSTVDYDFEDLPDSLEAGPVSFELQNDGTEAHELVLLRKDDGLTLSTEELLALPQEEGESMVTFIGVAEPVPAGEGSHMVAELEPGDYVAVCFIPTGTTSFDGPPGDGPPHMAHGMFADLTVT
jgi:hypothetical protein